MLKSLLILLVVLLAVLVALCLIAHFVVRAIFVRLGERISADIERRLTAAWARGGGQEAAQGTGSSGPALARIERIACVMDSAISLPIIGGIGMDSVIGLVPVAGDVVSAAISLQLIRRSLEFGLPRALICKMIANTLTDLLLGLIPVVGDLTDITYRVNSRNVRLLKDHLRQRGSQAA